MSKSAAFERGLPANLDAERFVLGSILLEPQTFQSVANIIQKDDFSLEANRRIFERMTDLDTRGDKIDRITVADELVKKSQLESVGGISYLVSLDDGLPQIFNLDSYVNIVREKARLRAMIYSMQRVMDKAFLGEDTPDDLVIYAQQELESASAASNLRCGLSLGEFIDQYPGGIGGLLDFKTRTNGVLSGFQTIDEITGGFLPGSINVIAGWPGTGKSAFLANLARNMATKNDVFIIFSPEMTMEPIFYRMLAREANISLNDLRASNLNANERRQLMLAIGTLADIGIYIEDSSGITPYDIHSKVSSMKAKLAKEGKRVIGVGGDYFQLIKAPEGMRFSNDTSKQDWISNALMISAKKLRLPYFILSQLRKADAKESKQPPALDDLRGSGLGPDSWFAMILRSMFVKERPETKGRMVGHVVKNRLGDIKDILLQFDGGKAFFSERYAQTCES